MFKRFGSVLLSLLMIFVLFPAAATAGSPPVVSLSLSKTQIAPGEESTLTASIADGSDVYGAAVDVIYDPAKLEFVSAATDTMVTAGVAASAAFSTTVGAVLPGGNRQSVISLRLGVQPGANGDGSLGALTFKAVAGSSGVVPFVVDGTHVTVQLVDSNGQSIDFTSSTTPVNLTIGGTTKVTPAITAPVDGALTGDNPLGVSGTAAPGSQLVPYVDGTALSETITTSADGSFSCNVSLGADGTHSIQVKDVADSSLASAVLSVSLDTEAPEVSVSTIQPNTSTTVSGTVTDAHMQTLYIQVNPTGAPTAADQVSVGANGSFSKNVTLTSGITNVVYLKAVDALGNVTEKSVPVLVDPNGLRLKLVPSQDTVPVGGTFTVNVLLENGANVAGVDVAISFPPSLLQVVDADADTDGIQITGGSLLPLVGTNAVDNVAGTLRFAAGSSTPKTSGTIATIAFSANAAGPATVAFTSSEIQNPDTQQLTHAAVNASVNVVSGGTVKGQVTLQGRGTTARGGIPVKVVGQPISITTAADGTFTLTGVPAGTQRLLIRFPNPNGASPAYIGFLAATVDNITVSDGSTTDVPAVALRGGDANGDNKVSLSDLILLAQSYGLSSGQNGYKAAADFNGDNKVSLSDLIILAGNYGMAGATIPAGE